VHYGLIQPEDWQRLGLQESDPTIPLSRKLLAVPFLGKDAPSSASEFANPEVR
jgi:hypothetical protein